MEGLPTAPSTSSIRPPGPKNMRPFLGILPMFRKDPAGYLLSVARLLEAPHGRDGQFLNPIGKGQQERVEERKYLGHGAANFVGVGRNVGA